MATNIDSSTLVLNPKEQEDFQKFVFERVFDREMLNRLHTVWSGVQMKEQIVFGGRLSKVGVKDSTCARPNSGAASVFTQKYWEPRPVGDTLIHCQKDVNALFKAYYSKIKQYSELYDIEGSDEYKFMAMMFEEAINESLYRLIWFGDPNVVQAGAAQEGVVLAANVKFYDSVYGLWKRIFAAVTAAQVKRYTITENSAATPALQLTLAAGRSVEIFEGVWALADPRLKSDPNKFMCVNNAIWENYRQYLQKEGINFTIEYTTEGFQSLKWNSVNIVNMETLWDLNLHADFVAETTTNKLYLPNRVVFTVPANIPIATLNENDFAEMESWYNQDDRVNKMAFGYTLDTQVLEGYMMVTGY